MRRIVRSLPAAPPPAPPPLAGALDSSDCRFALQPSGVTYYCVWEFPFRAHEATSAFVHLSAALEACFGDRATERDDLRVNHPDSYRSHEFLVDDASVTVSLKDKSGLGKSLIFLRVTEGPAPQ